MNPQTPASPCSTGAKFVAGHPVDYRVRLADKHDPRGPDGKGWNRLAIIVLGPTDRCIRMPKTRQAALDTLRGMARHGSITSYDVCTNGQMPCQSCPVATKERDPWNDGWHIREDARGIVWLLGNVDKAFSGRGYYFKGWTALMAAVEVPMLQRMQDDTGFYWISA
ncbi:hypothetical protein [Cupriavidus sp. UYPR2.512]|uniref:hypothetical protein n=1 Tax=Cupriavidus sp. UYPR2.512 TaxID=1080187 RepID=UPI00037F3D45|nr:hypothetical protein [Cupriavidus sp. UYPR2.512]